LDYEDKIKTKEIPIIFALCFIPGISINILIYFLSIIGVKFKNNNMHHNMADTVLGVSPKMVKAYMETRRFGLLLITNFIT
jgi:uncharacterized membrane protein YdjX (TVP38/TMEM64 family)